MVTGGAGFIGCAISKPLADAYDRVIVVDNLHPQIHARPERPEALDERAELIVADVTQAATWDQLFADGFRPDAVVHLAAETGTGQSLSESTRHASVNVVGTTQLLDGLRRNEALPERIVLASSRAVYGEGAWVRSDGTTSYPGPRSAKMLEASQWDYPDAEPLPMDARVVRPDPASIYAVTKLAQEQILTLWADAYQVPVGIVRLQNVYGPGQSLNNSYTGILSLFCRLARQGATIPIYEDGQIRRDFVLIDDVADAIVARLTSSQCDPTPIDIGSGEFQTIETAARIIAEHYGAPAPQVTGQFRHGDVRHAWADTQAARSELGFTAKYSLRAGIERLTSWIDAQLDETKQPGS